MEKSPPQTLTHAHRHRTRNLEHVRPAAIYKWNQQMMEQIQFYLRNRYTPYNTHRSIPEIDITEVKHLNVYAQIIQPMYHITIYERNRYGHNKHSNLNVESESNEEIRRSISGIDQTSHKNQSISGISKTYVKRTERYTELLIPIEHQVFFSGVHTTM